MIYTRTTRSPHSRGGIDVDLAACVGVGMVMEVKMVVEVGMELRQLRTTRLAALGTCNDHVTRQLGE